jgi:hypothetical protein
MQILSRSPRFRLAYGCLLVSFIILAPLFSGTAVMGQTIYPTAPPQNTQTGQVVSIDADGESVIIQSGDLSTITVQVDLNTLYYTTGLTPKDLSGLLNVIEAFMGQGKLSTDALSTFVVLSQQTQSASFNDITVGDILAVDPSSADPAVTVLIVKIPCVKGTVTAVDSDSFTITTSDGKTVTLGWDSSTRFIFEGLRSLETGLNANVIYDKAANSALIVVISAPSTSPLQPSQ